MRSRGLVVAIAVVLAVWRPWESSSTRAAFGKTRSNENTTPVLASTQDIQANTPLDSLIQSGVFETIPVPNVAVVPNAVRDVSELQGQ